MQCAVHLLPAYISIDVHRHILNHQHDSLCHDLFSTLLFFFKFVSISPPPVSEFVVGSVKSNAADACECEIEIEKEKKNRFTHLHYALHSMVTFRRHHASIRQAVTVTVAVVVVVVGHIQIDTWFRLSVFVFKN